MKKILVSILLMLALLTVATTTVTAAAGETNVGIQKTVASYDPASFGRRLTFRLEYYVGEPTQRTS